MLAAALSVMRDNPYEIVKEIDGSPNRLKIRFDVGLTAMMKWDCSPTMGPDGSAGKEEASYIVACQLGLSHLVPPTVVRILKDGSRWSIQQWCVWPSWTFPSQSQGNQALEDMALFDSVIGNQDRHSANILAKSPSKISCIDNGMGMVEDTTYGQHPARFIYSNRGLSIQNVEVLEKFLDRSDEIILELEKLVTATAITKMFSRIKLMLENNQFPKME